MTTRKLLITGFGRHVTEEGVRTWLGNYGPVLRIDIVRDGNAADPFVIAQMAIDDVAAAHLVSRLQGYWHEGAMIDVRLLHR